DADDLALQLGAVMDGLAIQVLLNDTVMTPKRMQEIVTDAAVRLIGYDPAAPADG
ncbi:MAG: TetR family transcriptional regulator C-terminal domain-containing protein, partial [Actinomycetota bacterium]